MSRNRWALVRRRLSFIAPGSWTALRSMTCRDWFASPQGLDWSRSISNTTAFQAARVTFTEMLRIVADISDITLRVKVDVCDCPPDPAVRPDLPISINVRGATQYLP